MMVEDNVSKAPARVHTGRSASERMAAAGQQAEELFQLIQSTRGLPQREQLDLCSQLGKIKVEAAGPPAADDPFDDVDSRFKYFVSLAVEVPQLLLSRSQATDFTRPLMELRTKIQAWAGPCHWRKVALRKAS